MLLAVQHGLVQVGNAPALGDVEAEALCQTLRRLAGDGVAPGAEGGERFAVPVEGQVAVHHAGDAQGPHLREGHAVLLPHIPGKVRVAGLDAPVDLLQGIGPDAVLQLVLPVEAAGGRGDMALVDEHRLDPGGAELNAQGHVFEIHPITLLICYDAPEAGRTHGPGVWPSEPRPLRKSALRSRALPPGRLRPGRPAPPGARIPSVPGPRG